MTIRNKAAFNRSLPDWAMLDGCFDDGITPSDVDGQVERRGWLLQLEHKGKDAQTSRGQRRTFKSAAARGITVIVFWCNREDGQDTEYMTVYRPPTNADDGVIQYGAASLDDLRSEVSAWFHHATENAKPSTTTFKHVNKAFPSRKEIR